MATFQNDYDEDGTPICPRCSMRIRSAEPAARADDVMTHLRCLWAESRKIVPPRAAEPATHDSEMTSFFAAIARVLRRIRHGGREDAHSDRPAA